MIRVDINPFLNPNNDAYQTNGRSGRFLGRLHKLVECNGRYLSVTKSKREKFIELPEGFGTQLRNDLALVEDEKPRISYLSLANDVARVQQYWVDGVHDPKSQKATYAGMFFELVEALGAQGQLFSTKDTKAPLEQPVQIERFDASSANLIGQVVARIQAFKPHLLVISPSVSPDIIPMLAQDFPTVYYAHSLLWPARWDCDDASLKERLKRWVRSRRFKNKLKNVKGVIAASDVCLRQFRAIVGNDYPEETVTRQFLHVSKQVEKKSMRNLLYIGGLDDWSGVNAAVAVFKAIKADLPNLTLSLIGEGPKQAEYEEMAPTVDGLRFVSKFDATEQMKQVAMADLLIVPEIAQTLTGMPFYLPEALVCGLPALVSSSVPLRDDEERGCVVYKAGDQEDMIRQIRRLYGDTAEYKDLAGKLPLNEDPFRDASQSWGSGIARIFGHIARNQ